MSMEANCRLIEVDQLPCFFADDVASVMVIGPNIRVVFFEFRNLCGELVKYPVMEMVRPMASYTPGHLVRMIAEAKAVRDAMVVLH